MSGGPRGTSPPLDLVAMQARVKSRYFSHKNATEALLECLDDVDALLAHARALRAALQDEPFGESLLDVLKRATEMLWAAADDSAPQYRDDLREMGRILSGRAVRIQEQVTAVLAAAQDGPA